MFREAVLAFMGVKDNSSPETDEEYLESMKRALAKFQEASQNG